MVMRFFRKKTVWVVGLAGCLLTMGTIVAIKAAPDQHPQSSSLTRLDPGPQDAVGEPGALSVRTIFPKCDPSFVFSVQEPATVTAYYVAELDAQVAGQLEFIRKAEGSPVVTR